MTKASLCIFIFVISAFASSLNFGIYDGASVLLGLNSSKLVIWQFSNPA